MRLRIAAALLLSTTVPVQATGIEAAAFAIGQWYATLGVAGQLLVQVGVGLALTAASYGIQYLVSGAGRRQGQASREAQGTQVPEFDALLETTLAYGTVTHAGGVFFNKTVADSGSSAPDRWVFGLALSEGQCEELVSVIINGVECSFDSGGDATTAPWFDGSISYLSASFRSGATDQAIDPIISARFPSPPDDFYPGEADRVTRWAQFRQRGVCTLVIDAAYGDDADHHTELWGVAGVPQLQVRFKGRKVYDRTDPTQDPDDASTWTWSDIATVAIEDYICHPLGWQADRDAIDDTAARESLAIDREYIPTLAGYEQRGRVNGVVSSTEAPTDVLASMAQQSRATISKDGASYRIRSDRAAEAVATIHARQWLRDGTISMQNEPDSRATIGGLIGQFYPASRLGQAAETAYPSTALDDDAAERVTFRFGDSAAATQRLLYAMRAENGEGRTISGTFDLSVLVAMGKSNRVLEVGDVVNWQGASPYSDLDGLYRVDSIAINPMAFAVSLSLTGTSATIINGWSTALETALDDVA